MLERIPRELQELAAWTVSGSTKIPLDPYALLLSNQYKGYSPTTDKLMPLKTIKGYLDEMRNPELKAAIRLTEDIPYVIVDIEPEGMMANNPYFKWPYIYLEYSRNHGLHGILPFDPPKEYDYLRNKFTVKDKEWETEILIANGHFATFTFNERPLNQYEGRVSYSSSKAFQLELAQHLAERTTKTATIHGEAAIAKGILNGVFKTLVEEDIHPADEEHIRDVLLDVDPLVLYPSDDASKEEYKKMLQIYGKLVRKQPVFLSEGALTSRTIPVMWKLVHELIHPRPKHYGPRNSQTYGRVPWLAYTMLRAMEYIRNQSLEDPETAEWVTKT